MRVLVPAEELRATLGSRARLEQRWASDCGDAMVLLQTLQLPDFTLEDVLDTGFVTFDTNHVSSGQVALRHRVAVSIVETFTGEGDRVRSPQQHPRQVAVVAVHDFTVNGVSAVRRSA